MGQCTTNTPKEPIARRTYLKNSESCKISSNKINTNQQKQQSYEIIADEDNNKDIINDSKDILLVTGYIQKIKSLLPNNTTIPLDIITLCCAYYGKSKNVLYVVGNNDHYQSGDECKRSILNLTEWTNKNISVYKINFSGTGLTIIDNYGRLWIMGYIYDSYKHYNWYSPQQINFFHQNNMTISRVFSSVAGYCTFWQTHNNKIYIHGRKSIHDRYNANKYVPTLIGFNNIISICSGVKKSLALDNNGNVFMITGNLYKDMRYKHITWQQYKGLKNIAKIATGYNHSLFLETNGILWCVGDNTSGQLGPIDNDRISTPLKMQWFKTMNIKEIACGNNHNLVIDSNANIWSWGFNGRG
eukprot:253976_1